MEPLDGGNKERNERTLIGGSIIWAGYGTAYGTALLMHADSPHVPFLGGSMSQVGMDPSCCQIAGVRPWGNVPPTFIHHIAQPQGPQKTYRNNSDIESTR